MFFRPWCLANTIHGWRINGLSTREARAIVATLKDYEKSATWVWKKPWNEWKELKSAEVFHLTEEWKSKISSIPMIWGDRATSDEDTQVRVLHQKEQLERRHHRYVVRMPVAIHVSNNQFTTHTKDISEGGMLLEDALPGWIAGYCHVQLQVGAGKVFSLLCTLVEDQKHEKVRLEVVPTEQSSEYRKWLNLNFSSQS